MKDLMKLTLHKGLLYGAIVVLTGLTSLLPYSLEAGDKSLGEKKMDLEDQAMFQILKNYDQSQDEWKGFLGELSKRSQKAQMDETEAIVFYARLKHCLEQKDLPLVQAVCFIEARQLIKKYPKLGEKEEGLVQGLSDHALNLIRLYEMI